MLTDSQIKEEIKLGNILVDPFVEKNIGPSSYHVTLGHHFLVPNNDKLVDFKDPQEDGLYKEVTASDILLEPGDFVLGQTLESIELANNLSAMLDGRTTLARLGITIHQTATVLLAGHKGIITLEIANLGKFKVRLLAEMKIAKLVFFKASEAASIGYSDLGRYGKQTKVTGSLLKNDSTLF